jgi:carbamoyl-phosphate synthase large subunit
VASANVLVTGAGSILGQGIIKSLKFANNQQSSSVKYRIFSADMSPQAAGLYRCYKAFLIPAPSSDEYAEQIIQICKENDIDAVFVGTDEELMPLAALKDRIKKESGAILITNPESVIKIASDKWTTYEYLKKNNIPCAKSALPVDSREFIDEFGFPIVVKPREGHGSLHFYIVNNYDELKQVISFIEMVGWRPILQEYLEGNNEFTSGITIDKSGKKVMSTISMRKIIKNGQTYKAFIDDFDPVRRSAQEVARKIGANGAINIQAKMVDDKHKVFEINARFSATCPLRAVAGINEPDIVYRNVLLDEEIKIDSYQKLVCMRYWNEVYVPMPAYEKFRAKKIIQDTDSFIPHYF